MGLADLSTPSPPNGSPLGWELLKASGQRCMQVGSVAGLVLSPAAWLLMKQRSPGVNIHFYNEALPRSGSFGLVSGAVIGACSVLVMASRSGFGELQSHAILWNEVENERMNQWATLGAGTGGMFATPGPGSALFRETHWVPRLGGGIALGFGLGLAAFALSCQEIARPYLHYLPETMQPVRGRLDHSQPRR